MQMMREYYHVGRIIDGTDEMFDIAALRKSMIDAHVDVGAASRFSQILRVSTLDRLLEGGHISFKQYLDRLPDGVISNKSGLIDEIDGDAK